MNGLGMQKFEHPLNERTRIYLRIESLFRKLGHSADLTQPFGYQVFFSSLFNMLDILEQVQVKADLGKDLEKLRLQYRAWMDIEGVDQSALLSVLEQISQVHHNLMQTTRPGHSLKEDRFLSALKQRFFIPGGDCCFDLPALHHWLHLPLEVRCRNTHNWMSQLLSLSDALSLWLRLTRETARFEPQIARNGFMQSEMENANLLRLEIPIDNGVYPMISGHKSRFALRFMSFETNKNCEKDIEFMLAVC